MWIKATPAAAHVADQFKKVDINFATIAAVYERHSGGATVMLVNGVMIGVKEPVSHFLGDKDGPAADGNE